MSDPVEVMARAISPAWFESGKIVSNYPGQDVKFQERAREYARNALTALEASGWRLVHPDQVAGEMIGAGGVAMFKSDMAQSKPRDATISILKAAIRAAPTYGELK